MENKLQLPYFAPSTNATAANQDEEVVLNFLNLFSTLDKENCAAKIEGWFTPDAIYDNMPSPLAPCHGIESIKKTVAGFLTLFTIDIVTLRISSNNGVVFTERIDSFTSGEKKYDLLLMGIFELQDGKIKAWRDYFDLHDVEEGMGILLH